MWEEILRLAVGNGLWAVLFCVLLFYLIRETKRREERYAEIIGSLSDRLKTVNDIRAEVSDIKLLICGSADKAAACGRIQAGKNTGFVKSPVKSPDAYAAIGSAAAVKGQDKGADNVKKADIAAGKNVKSADTAAITAGA